jgi:hypothetical protein
VTATPVWFLFCDHIGGEPRYLALYTRPFAGQDRNFLFFYISGSGYFSRRTGFIGF